MLNRNKQKFSLTLWLMNQRAKWYIWQADRALARYRKAVEKKKAA